MKGIKSISSNIFWIVTTLIVLSLIFSFLIDTSPKPEIFTIDQLVFKINNQEISKIVVSGNDIKITLKNGQEAISTKETESSFSQTLINYGVNQKVLQTVALEIKTESGFKFWLGILLPTLLPLIVIVVIFWFIFRRAQTGANNIFSFSKASIRLFISTKDRLTFKDVAGLEEVKLELEEIIDFLKNPKKFFDIGARIPRGVLLMGPPGTGKTLLARAVAGEARVPFFHISASEFVEMFVGIGAARTRDAFATAKKAAPSILFIDEIDAVGRQRGAGLGGGHDEREQTLNQILVELDGFERDTKVIVLAATNRPDILDPALLRPGRFDRRVILDLPDIKARGEILRLHAKGKNLEKNIDFKKIAIRTPGFSGADLANLMNESAILAARQNKKIISEEDILESIEKVLLGPERKSLVISEKEKQITAYHEAGHALASVCLKDADPIQKVSIISRGRAGGYTLRLPIEELRLRTRSQFFADLIAVLGGYAAEKQIFNDISTGASNDLKEASELARKMITKYGMSEKLGPITFGKSEELIFLGREISTEKNYSEKISAEIDKEVSNFINKAYETAKKILSTHKKILQVIAEVLLEKEVLEYEEFYKLLKPFNLSKIAI